MCGTFLYYIMNYHSAFLAKAWWMCFCVIFKDIYPFLYQRRNLLLCVSFVSLEILSHRNDILRLEQSSGSKQNRPFFTVKKNLFRFSRSIFGRYLSLGQSCFEKIAISAFKINLY